MAWDWALTLQAIGTTATAAAAIAACATAVINSRESREARRQQVVGRISRLNAMRTAIVETRAKADSLKGDDVKELADRLHELLLPEDQLPAVRYLIRKPLGPLAGRLDAAVRELDGAIGFDPNNVPD